MIESDSIQYGTTIIPYSISYSHRRKNATITVYPTKKVEIRVPTKTEQREIQDLMKKKAHWVIKNLEWYNQFQYIHSEKEYVNGETFLYLGRQYRLKIIKTDSELIAKLKGKYFEVTIPEKMPDNCKVELVKEALYRWYKARATQKIDELVTIYSKKLGIDAPPFKVKLQLKRWGSCTQTNKLNFNMLAVMAPMAQIEYVIAHELCHVKYKNHSAQFWQLLRIIMPDYEIRKENLRKDGWKYSL